MDQSKFIKLKKFSEGGRSYINAIASPREVTILPLCNSLPAQREKTPTMVSRNLNVLGQRKYSHLAKLFSPRLATAAYAILPQSIGLSNKTQTLERSRSKLATNQVDQMNNSRFELPSVQSIESPTNRFQPPINTTEFLLQNNNSQQELQHASDNGYYTVLLVKDLLREAYLAQTQKNYDKAVQVFISIGMRMWVRLFLARMIIRCLGILLP